MRLKGCLVREKRSYRGHQLVSGPDPSDLVPIEYPLDEFLHRVVPLHEGNVKKIEAEEHKSLIPMYIVIAKEVDQGEKTSAVKGAIAKQWPPCEREYGPREDSAHADDEENIKNGRPHDGTDPHIVERDENPDDRGK